MRFKEAYNKCLKEVSEIEEYYQELYEIYETKDFKSKSTEMNFNRMYESIYEYAKNKLGDIPYLNNTLYGMNGVILSGGRMTDKMNMFIELHQKIHNLISIYESMEKPVKEDIGMEIKIPDTNSITELKKYIDGIEFAFTKCPFFQSDEASLKLEAVDNGSIWLIIGVTYSSVVAGSMLLNNIASFIDKCFIIKSHKLTCLMQEQKIKNNEMEQKEKEELLKSVNKLYKMEVKNTIKELEESTGYHIQDGDEMGRVEQSFEKIGKLLDQGLQIYSSINCPEEVKAVFAPLEMHYLSVGKELERIEKKTDTGME